MLVRALIRALCHCFGEVHCAKSALMRCIEVYLNNGIIKFALAVVTGVKTKSPLDVR